MRVVGAGGLLIGLMLVAMFVPLILALVDMLRRPSDVWARSGQNQLVWALVIVFVGVIGPILYLVIARPALNGVGGAVGEVS